MKIIVGRIGALLMMILIFSPGFSETAAAKEKPRRVVKIKVVADQHYAKLSVWERKAGRQLLDIAEEVTKLLNVDFEIVGFEVWEHEDDSSLFHLTSQMVEAVDPGEADALIGFTYAPCPAEKVADHTGAVTIPYKGMLVETYHPRCRRSYYLPFVMIHEMVHLFGGVHVNERSLMSPLFAGTIALELDPLNKNIVRLTSNIDFKTKYQSLNPGTLEKLASAYRQAVVSGNREPVTLDELGAIYLALGHYQQADEVLDYALAVDSTFTGVWLRLSECRRAMISADSAIAFLNTALDHADDRGVIYSRLARLYFENSEKEAASRCADSAMKYGAKVDSMLPTQPETIPDPKP